MPTVVPLARDRHSLFHYYYDCENRLLDDVNDAADARVADHYGTGVTGASTPTRMSSI
jgi:hypothetical protein